MRALIFSAVLGPLFLLAGCQSPHVFKRPDASWQSHVGQLKFTNKQTTVIGDVVVQRNGPKQFQLDFIKTGGIPLMTVREDATKAHTEGLLVRRAWEGDPKDATKTLRPWLALRDAFQQPRPQELGGIKLWQGQAEYRDGLLSEVTLTFPEYGQQFVFQFHP